MWLKLTGSSCERGSHLPAWTAPGSPEIDEQGNVAFARMSIEVGCREDHGLPQEEHRTATAALTIGARPFQRYSVGGRASRTDDDFAI